MRIRSEQYISIVAIVALAFLASCTRNVKETQLTTENAKFNLIIAGDSSDFKDKVRNRIIARYSNSGNIDVVNIKKLSGRLHIVGCILAVGLFWRETLFLRLKGGILAGHQPLL